MSRLSSILVSDLIFWKIVSALNKAVSKYVFLSVLVFLWTCETPSGAAKVLFQSKICILKSPDKIPACVLAPPSSLRMHPVETFVDLRQQCIAECISHQQAAAIEEKKENPSIFKVVVDLTK